MSGVKTLRLAVHQTVIAAIGIAAAMVVVGCSPCRLFLDTGDYGSPRDRLDRQDDQLVVTIHRFSPELVTPERFNPHAIEFDESASDFDRRPPVLAITALRDLPVERVRPIPDDAPPLDRDVEFGLAAGTLSREQRSATRTIEFGGEEVVVEFTVRRTSRPMQMYRIPYRDARLPADLPAEEGEPDSASEAAPGGMRAWITGPPEAWRVRDVTLEVQVTATLPDVLAGHDEDDRNPDELVQLLEKTATPVFRDLYRELVMPGSEPDESRAAERREAGDYAADRLEQRLDEQRAQRELRDGADGAEDNTGD